MKVFLQRFLNTLATGSSADRGRDGGFPYDFREEEKRIIERVSACSMTSKERLVSLLHGIEHISRNRIPGDVVECGVWRGGSMMAAALRLMELNDTERTLYLYDTFEGMPEPTESDLDQTTGIPAGKTYRELEARNQKWCQARLEEVRNNLAVTGYPADRIRYVEGKVEDTLLEVIPEAIALLRLDTDWYESTREELHRLYPRLEQGGILIIDDYGYWAGARKAVDEFFEDLDPRPFLARIDETGRIAVKP